MEYPIPPSPTTMPPPAGFWVRALARIVDAIVVNFINVAAVFTTAVIGRMWAVFVGASPASVDALIQLRGADFIAGLFGAIMYQTFMEGLYGASVGKILFGLHVFRVDGSPCTLGCAFTRSLAYLIDSLFFGAVAFLAMNASPLRQRLGDRWAGSVVVNLKAVGRPPTHWGRFLGALFWAVVSCGVLSVIAIWVRLLGAL